MPKTSIAAPTAGLGAVDRGRRHQQLGDVGLQLFVGGAVFGVAEPAEQRRAVVDGDLLAAQVAVGDLVIVQDAERLPHPGDRRRRRRSRRSGCRDAGVCAYNVQPRSSAAIAIVVVLATPRSPIAIAISARCSTARRMEACSGAVSLLRSRSHRQNWRSDAAAALIRAVHLDDGRRLRLVGVAPRAPAARGPAGRTTVSAGHRESAPGQRADGAVERHLEGGRPDHEHDQRADEPADRQARAASGRAPRR